jgi:insulin receptor substrate 1
MMDKNWLVRGIIIIKFCVLISVVAASSVVVETDESSANKNTVSDIKISLVIADSHESNIRIPETISKREYSLHRNDVQIIIPGLEVADSSSSSDIIESIKSNVDSSDFDRNLSPVTIINKRETQSSRVNKAQFKSNQPEPEYKSLNIPSTFHALSPKLPILAPLLQPVLSPIVNSPVVNSPIVNSPIVNSPIVNSPIVNSPIVNSPESQPSTIEPTIHMNPSIQPSLLNGIKPSQQPTVTEYSLSPHSSQPSANPSYSSTLIPTIFPSYYPSNKPSSQSIKSSTFIPTVETISLSFEPTLESPVIESSNPTSKPTNPPTFIPSENPVDPKPVHPSIKPLSLPRIPAILPYVNSPISFPFLYPPSNPSENPTQQPTIEPTSIPTESFAPTVYGMTGSPTSLDTIAPSTDTPTLYPPGSIIFQDFGIQYNVKVPPTIVTIPASPVGSQVAISDLYIAVTSPRTCKYYL